MNRENQFWGQTALPISAAVAAEKRYLPMSQLPDYPITQLLKE